MAYLVQRVVNDIHRAQNYIHALAFGSLLFLPSTILILRLNEWPLILSVLIIVGGLSVVVIGGLQPDWIPDHLMRRSFGHHYFAATMFLSAFWSLAVSITSPTPVTPLLAIAAYSVGVASWNAAYPKN
jgi:hypothetical protein